jgi:hypothetical protein
VPTFGPTELGLFVQVTKVDALLAQAEGDWALPLYVALKLPAVSVTPSGVIDQDPLSLVMV